MRMRFVQTCTTQCISEIAAQSFFPPTGGGGVGLEKEGVLPDLHVEMITSWEEKKETWKTLVMEIKNICSHEVIHWINMFGFNLKDIFDWIAFHSGCNWNTLLSSDESLFLIQFSWRSWALGVDIYMNSAKEIPMQKSDYLTLVRKCQNTITNQLTAFREDCLINWGQLRWWASGVDSEGTSSASVFLFSSKRYYNNVKQYISLLLIPFFKWWKEHCTTQYMEIQGTGV